MGCSPKFIIYLQSEFQNNQPRSPDSTEFIVQKEKEEEYTTLNKFFTLF